MWKWLIAELLATAARRVADHMDPNVPTDERGLEVIPVVRRARGPARQPETSESSSSNQQP